MKTTIIYSMLLVAGTALAVPATRGDKVVTISELRASQTDQTGYVTFKLNDPNYHDATVANVIWDRPGNPQANSRTNDGAYLVHFPGGVKDISAFDLQLQRVKGTEDFSVTVNDKGKGGAQDTKWICSTAKGPEKSKKCHYDGDITLVPS
ncbi:hypothetical protein N7510_002610 [Penicillium lagena]|uniref:uncharacterized protein n=1 Tax=Penicillium lagena TaxID=94218 RepID=UPI00253F6CF3|nr:uncharacterized protein N7510_002610 [Penicillium lagena]KAJ5626301.1 hypothetical protein N7510_002610 [Penicillium lagena]